MSDDKDKRPMGLSTGPLGYFVNMADIATRFLQEKQYERRRIEKALEGFDLKIHRERMPFLRRLQVNEAAIITARDDVTKTKEIVQGILNEPPRVDDDPS